MFFNRKKHKQREAQKEAERNDKMRESQTALLSAAIATADMAQEVTTGLKKRLEDIVRQFESTARILRDGLVICTEDGTITTFNPAAERIFGIKSGSILRRSVLPLFDGAKEPIEDTRLLWQLLQNEDQNDVLGVRDGQTFPIRVTMSTLDRHDGTRVVLLLVHDVRDDPPARRERKYQSIFESSFDGIVVVLAENGSVLAANPAVARMFGYDNEAVTGLTIFDLVTPRDHATVGACCLDRSGPVNSHHFSVDGIHKSGRVLSLIFTLTEISWEGRSATLATIKDVTEMRRVESAVSLKRDNGIDMVVTFDPNFRITFANETFAAWAKRPRKDLIGEDVRALFSEPDTATMFATLFRLSPDQPSARSQTKEGDYFYDWVDHAYFDEEGRAVEFHRTGRDIAEIVNQIWD